MTIKTIKKYLTLAAIAGSTMLGACAPPPTIETEFKKKFIEAGKTQQEADVGFVYGTRQMYLKKEIGPDGKERYVPDYQSIPLSERIKQNDEMLGACGALLGYANESNADFVDEFGLRPRLLKREAAIRYNNDRMNLVRLHEELMALLAGNPAADGKLGVSEAELSYPLSGLEKKLNFVPEYLEEAAKQGRLSPLEQIRLIYGFEKEIPNPDYPDKDNTRKTIWKAFAIGVSINSYDTDFPRDRAADYIEIIRGGEPQPAVAIYHDNNSKDLTIAVIDSDPAGTPGNGAPDAIEIVAIGGARELLTDEKLLARIFTPKSARIRARPARPPMTTQIVRVGEVAYDPWEKSASSFEVPFGEYKSQDGGNYTLRVAYGAADGGGRKVKYVAKVYHMPGDPSKEVEGRVIEYYRLKKEYDKPAANIITGNSRLSIDYPGKQTQSGIDSIFLEAKPYRKDYDFGTSRFRIEDRDGKDPLYESRREYEKPKETTLED